MSETSKKFLSINNSSIRFDVNFKKLEDGETAPANFNKIEYLCEKIPYLPSNLLSNDCYIYPLGGNLREYKTLNFFNRSSNESSNNLWSKSDFSSNSWYGSESNYSLLIGSNWLGSFSVNSYDRDRNGNLFNYPADINHFGTFSGNEVFNVSQRSIIRNHNDRTYLKFSGEREYYHTFSGLDASTTYCFSFYMKVKNGGTCYLTIPSMVEGQDPSNKILVPMTVTSESDFKVEIPDYYERFIIRGNSSSNGEFTVRFDIGNTSGTYEIDICGVCLSKGKTPCEVHYDTNVNDPLIIKKKYCPIALTTGLSGSSWTVKYKRYLFSDETDKPFKDWVGGVWVKYPYITDSIDNTEYITVRKNNGTYSVRVSSVTSNGIKTENVGTVETTGYSSMTIDERENISILLGGEVVNGSFVAYPGIYRDVLIFPNTFLSDDTVKKMDDSIMSLTFADDTGNNKYTFVRGSIFEETL